MVTTVLLRNSELICGQVAAAGCGNCVFDATFTSWVWMNSRILDSGVAALFQSLYIGLRYGSRIRRLLLFKYAGMILWRYCGKD